MANEGIELEIYSFNNPNNKIDTLEGRREPKYLEELDDVGGGSFKISRNDPKIVNNRYALLRGRNVCKYKVDGKIVGAFLLQNRKSVYIGEGEEKDAAYEIAGEGLMTWFNDAAVFPWAGLDHKTRDKRSFSFASPYKGDWYIDSKWIEPKAALTWTKITGNPWKYQPTNWPADLFPNARWVWGTSNSDQVAPEGTNYFRWSRSFSQARKCSLYIAADNSYQVYLDGEQIAESDPGVSTFYECQKIDFDVDEGTHVVGIAVSNGNAKVKVQHAGLLAGLVYYTADVPDTNLGNVSIDIHENARVHRQSHGLANDDKVYFSSTGQLPTPLSTERNYFVADRDSNSFALQRTTSGAYIDTEGAQSGTHTLFKSGLDATPQLLSYTGMTDDYVSLHLSDAKNAESTLLIHYQGLPDGANNSNSSKRHKQQFKVKAAAKTRWQKAKSVRQQWETEYAAVGTTQQWRVLPYPSSVPGFSPGEILLKLMSEATSRGVDFPSWLNPTFTTTHDSEGVAFGDALEWTFNVGTDNLMTVVQKMQELQVSIWIDPTNLNLNMAISRGNDRAGDANAVVFEQGKNISGANTTSVTKIKNSLLLKTSTGWAANTADQTASQNVYGTIEDVLDFDGKESVARRMASQVFSLDATEEEGASYDIFPTDKLPFIDFYVGDWVSAPNDTGSNVKRRVSSLSIEENDNGLPKYSAEFDTIFHYSEDRINRILAKTGQRGATGGSGLAAGGQVPASQSNLLLPPVASPLTIPTAPDNTVGYPAATWDASGTSIIGEAVLTWDPVDTATDGSQIVVPGYTVYGRMTVDADNPDGGVDVTEADWVEFTRVPTAMAIIPGFTPGDTWQFEVAAQSPYGADYIGDFGDVVEIQMGVPTEPMDPPTPPVVDSKLGVGIINWDGLLRGDAGDHQPDPQFREVIVGVGTKSGGPYDYTVGTPMTLGAPQAYVTGFNVGSTIYVVLKAVDGIGIESDPSTEGSGIIKGVDLGSLAADLVAANKAVSEAAGNAQTIADQSAATAGSALDLAGDARAAAQNAQQSADGKNKITYASVDAPSTGNTGRTVGDLWYKYTGQLVTGFWRWDGGSWQVQTMSSLVIANLDAGKITTGTLDAARIAARSISVNQLAIGDFTNLFPSPRMLPETGGYLWDQSGYQFPYSAGDVPDGGRAWVMQDRDNLSNFGFPVHAGDSFYLEFTGKRIQGGLGMEMSLWVTEADGSGGGNWAPYSLLGTGNQYQILDLGGNWYRYANKITIPADWQGVTTGRVYFQINKNPATDNSATAVTNVIVRHAGAGQLIVDGTITANLLQAGSVVAGKLSGDSVYANNIAAGQITTNKIAVGAIDSVVITSAVVRSNNNPGNTGVQMDSGGLHAWVNGQQVFNLGSDGNVSITGYINATGGNFTGNVNAQSGTLGNLSVNGQLNLTGGAVRAVRSDGLTTQLDQGGVFVSYQNAQAQMQPGSFYITDGTRQGSLRIDDGGFTQLYSIYGNAVRLSAGGQFYVSQDDQGGRIYSMDIRNRGYSTSGRTDGSDNRLMVVTSSGTLGALTGTINSNYISTSSKRYKHDIEDYAPDLEALLSLRPVSFRYNSDDSFHVGMIAEEVAEAGLEEFVVRDTEGKIETLEYIHFGAALLALAQNQEKRIKELEQLLAK